MNVPAEIADLVNLEAVKVAEAALAEHQQRLATARSLATQANDAVTVARAEMDALVDRAFRDGDVTSEWVAAAHHAARDAEVYAAFLATVARRFEEPVTKAQAVLADALHEAWTPVFRHGQDLRIAAAAKADRARLLPNWGPHTFPDDVPKIQAARKAAFDAAMPDFERGTALIEIAADRGCRMDLRLRVDKPTWPSTEDRERRYWSRPLSPEDLIHAA